MWLPSAYVRPSARNPASSHAEILTIRSLMEHETLLTVNQGGTKSRVAWRQFQTRKLLYPSRLIISSHSDAALTNRVVTTLAAAGYGNTPGLQPLPHAFVLNGRCYHRGNLGVAVGDPE